MSKVKPGRINTLTRIFSVAKDISFVSLGILPWIIVVLTMVNIIGRNFGVQPIGWYEIIRFLDVWIVFLGFSLSAFERGHLTISFLYDRYLSKFAVVTVGILLINVLSSVVLVIASYNNTLRSVGQASTTNEIPLVLLYVPGFIGFSLSALIALQQLQEYFTLSSIVGEYYD